jgi:hypothetical protein
LKVFPARSASIITNFTNHSDNSYFTIYINSNNVEFIIERLDIYANYSSTIYQNGIKIGSITAAAGAYNITSSNLLSGKSFIANSNIKIIDGSYSSSQTINFTLTH